MAMQGILARGNHRCASVGSVDDAMNFISQHLKIDLVITELKLASSKGLELIRRIRADFFLRDLPILVYANKGDREEVKEALSIGLQNFLYKPYEDEALFQEIAKATNRPWYDEGFEEVDLDDHSEKKTPSDILQELNGKLETFNASLGKIRTALATKIESFTAETPEDQIKSLMQDLKGYSKQAEDAGAYRIYDCLESLHAKARTGSWSDFKYSLNYLDWGGRLIYYHLNPDALPEGFLGDADPDAILENRNRLFWATAARQGTYPVVAWSDLLREAKTLSGFPSVRTAAAAFQMSATGTVASLTPLMDLAERDPGLCLQVLLAANQLKKSKTDGPFIFIEDVRMAVGLLGEVRLASQARSLLRANEKWMEHSKEIRWSEFLKFQITTAHLAKFACKQMELSDLEPIAFTAGIIHQIGKLLLLRLHPAGFETIVEYAQKKKGTISEAEKLHFGGTSQELAAAFISEQVMPPRLANVIRFWHNPGAALEDSSLVALVALAHHLSLENQAGFSGELPSTNLLPLEKTPAWMILSGRVFPSFSLSKFQALARAYCSQL